MCVVPWCHVLPGRVSVRLQQVGVLLLLLLLLVQVLAGSSFWTCKQRKVRQQRQSWGAAASCLQQVCLAHNPHQFLADQIVLCTSTIAKLFRNDRFIIQVGQVVQAVCLIWLVDEATMFRSRSWSANCLCNNACGPRYVVKDVSGRKDHVWNMGSVLLLLMILLLYVVAACAVLCCTVLCCHLLTPAGVISTAAVVAPQPIDDVGAVHALYLDLGDLAAVEAFAGAAAAAAAAAVAVAAVAALQCLLW
jgi:uncharacterized integral membrane protein